MRLSRPQIGLTLCITAMRGCGSSRSSSSWASSPGAAIKFLGVRMWVAVVIALFGFWLSHTFLAPAIESGTRSGVGVVNGDNR